MSFDVDILAKSESHLLKVRIKELQFQDTLSIMNAGLGHLAQSHVQAGYNTRYAQEMVNYLPEDVRRVICTQKQFLCYEYITDLARLEDRPLQPRKAFYDTLKEKALSPGEYEHA